MPDRYPMFAGSSALGPKALQIRKLGAIGGSLAYKESPAYPSRISRVGLKDPVSLSIWGIIRGAMPWG